MRLGCPHCGAWFDVADERASDPTKSCTCPECLEVFPTGQARRQTAASSPDEDLDFGFELDGLSRAGLSQAGREGTGLRPAAEPSRISLSGVLGDESGIGFDLGATGDKSSQNEVSHLKDVDLTLAGTYHRTGRKLHHATDVVWTGRGRDGSVSRPPDASGAGSVPPRPTPRPSAPPPPLPTAPTAAFGGGSPTAAFGGGSPTAAFGGGREASKPSAFDDFPPLESSVAGAQQPVNFDFEDSLSMGGSLSGPARGAPEPSGRAPSGGSFAFGDRSVSMGSGVSVMGKTNAGALDEMDFSGLLDESLSNRSHFGKEQNPFADIGIGESSAHGRPTGPPPRQAPEPVSAPRRSTPHVEPSSFYVEAPSASNSIDFDVNEGDVPGALGGSFDLDLPGDTAAPLSAPTGATKAKAKRGSNPKSVPAGQRSNKGPIVALTVLVLVAGGGVAGELMGHGYFFVGLLEDKNTPLPGGVEPKPAPERMATPGTPGTPTTPEAQAVAALPAAGDSPASYDARLEALKKAVESEKDADLKATLLDQQLLTQLQFRFRWPGRFHHDETRKAALEKASADAKRRGFTSEFFDLLGQEVPAGGDRAAVLDSAEIVLAKESPGELSGGRDLLFKALLFRERKRPEQALQLLDLAAAEHPDFGWAQLERGAALLDQRRFEEAVASAEMVLAKEPQNHDARLLLGRTIVARQDEPGYEKARTVADEALAKAKETNDAYGEFEANLLRAQVAQLQGRNDDRRAALEAALAFSPKDETLMIELAEADLRTGNAAKAAERLGACPAEVCKSLAFIRTYLKILKATENLQEAENLTVKAELEFTRNAEVFFMSADVLELRGKLSLAAKKYEKVIEFDPKHLEAYLRLADIQKREKSFDKAVAILDKAAKAFEGGGAESEAAMSIAVERGELLAKQGRFDEAREVLTEVVNVQPTNAAARENLATLLVTLGQPVLAISHFDKLFEQGKTNPTISLAFAEALLMSGRPDRAIDVLKGHLEGNPKDLDALVKLGHAYVQKGRYEEAMAVLEHAVAINRNYAPAYYFAGLAEYGRQRRAADEAERRQREGETVPLDQRPDFAKAVLAFSNARDKDPENPLYREMLAKSLMELGKKRDLLAALEQYDAVIQAYRKYERAPAGVRLIPNAEVYFNRGVLASKLGRPREEILKNFQDALLLDSARADYIARYGEELYKLQTKEQQDGQFVLEAKAYFLLVRDHYSKTHVRSNYYLGRIALFEWGKQGLRKPGDALHKEALDYFNQVVAVGGQNEFPDVYFHIGNIQRELGVFRLADDAFMKYLDTYKRLYKRTAPNEKYVRELIKSRP